MRKHYVCRHTNPHAQTSRFHLYVNAPYVNKLCSTGGGRWLMGLCWSFGYYLIWTAFTAADNISPFKIQQHADDRKFRRISYILWKRGEGFWTVIWLDGSGAGQSKWFLTTMKLKRCVFLTHLLLCCSGDAAFIQSNFNLGLEDSINLWGCSQHKEDRKCWVV